MAEAARRTGYGHGSDVVRRLIARPIRLRGGEARTPLAPVSAPSTAPVTAETAPDSVLLAPVGAAVEPGPAETAPDLTRLRTEMMLLKAVLQAERRENATLRAYIGLDEAGDDLGPEARALRERWAVLIDRLLQAS